MDKKKILFFIGGNALAGVGIVLIVVVNIFALQGAAYLVLTVLSFAAGGFVLYLLSSWATKKESAILIGGADPLTAKNALNTCKENIAAYLRENSSTPFFRTKLSAVAERLNTFGLRCDKIRDAIIERFGSAGLSYSKFAAPVEDLRDYLVNLTNRLISRMWGFDEEEYSSRISEFTETNRQKEAKDYQEVEQEYKDYAEKTLAALDDAVLKLDRLALEISKVPVFTFQRSLAASRTSAAKSLTLFSRLIK